MRLWHRIRVKLNADPRLERVSHGFGSGLAGRCVSMLVGAMSLPLTVRFLGPQRYGVWISISSTVMMLAAMDLGVANTLTNLISHAYASDDRAAAKRSYATAFWVSVAISAVLGLLALALWPHVDWAALFHVTDAGLSGEVSICVAIAVTFFLVGMPLNLVNRVLSGYQQQQITNYFNVLSNILGLLAIVAVIKLHGSLVMLMLVYSSTLMTGSVILNIWVNFIDRRWLLPTPSSIEWSAIHSLMGSGMGFFMLQVAGLIVLNTDNLVISHYMGPADVVPYAVTWKVATYATILETILFSSLWPAYAEAYARGDYAWVRRTFWGGVRYGMGAVVLACSVLVVVGRPLIHWYVNASAVPSERLLIAICFWTIMGTGMNLQACLLAAVGRIKLQGVLSIVCSATNLWLSIMLVKRIGSLGAVLGTIISYAVVLVVPQTITVWRVLYRPPAHHSWPESAEAAHELADGKRAVRRALRPHRQRLEWLRRGAAVALFRGMVGLLRILRILPRGRRAAADVPASILIVHLTPHLGDSILLMPMIEALRAANPEARIECVVESSALPLLQAMSALDHAYGLRLHGPVGVTYWSSLQRAWEVARGYWLHLRALQPTVCLVPRWDNDLHRSAVLAYLIDAPRRVAFASDDNVWSRPAPYRDALFTQLVRGGSGLHEPVRLCLPAQLAGLIPDSALGAVSTGIVPSLAATAARQDWKLLSARTGIEPSEPFAVIAPGASAPNRIWPPERWLAVMHSLEAEGLHVVIMSGPQDVAVARQLHALGGGRATLLAGSTSLLESLSVVAHATIFLGNDSGPGHMAGALGVPSVILFSTGEATQIDGPSMPERIRPAGPGVRVVRPSRPAPPCTNLCECGTPHCILGVSTAQVLEAVRLVLQKR